MSKKVDRMNEIIAFLKQKNGCTVKELASHFQVSEMTIRRDLAVLHDRDVVSNVYGATIYNPQNSINLINTDYSLTKAKTYRNATKEQLGRLAASLIEPGDSIIIDTGSTTEQVAKYISVPCEVLCYNTNVMQELTAKDFLSITFAGGFYHSNTQMCESEDALSLIRSKRANKVFVSAAGVHKSLGVTCANSYEIATKKAIMNCSSCKILVADSYKFGDVFQSYFADLQHFDILVTDQSLSTEWISHIEALGVKILLA